MLIVFFLQEGCTLLIWASRFGQKEILETLLTKTNIDINAKDGVWLIENKKWIVNVWLNCFPIEWIHCINMGSGKRAQRNCWNLVENDINAQNKVNLA